jgi:hypothetical protein
MASLLRVSRIVAVSLILLTGSFSCTRNGEVQHFSTTVAVA